MCLQNDLGTLSDWHVAQWCVLYKSPPASGLSLSNITSSHSSAGTNVLESGMPRSVKIGQNDLLMSDAFT